MINVTNSPIFLLQEDLQLKWGMLALILFIISTAIGNILVCLAVCWERRLQNMTNYFLMSLAIADLLVAVLVMPLGLMVEMFNGDFPLGAQLCTLWATFDVGLCTASIWHMCTMSMDRYFTLKYPMKYGRNKTKNMVMMKIMFVWIISIAICSPVCILGFVKPSSIYNDRKCVPTSKNFIIYGSVFAFYIPLLIMVITYVLTTNILRNNSKLMRSMEQCRQQSMVLRKHFVPKQTGRYLSTNGYSMCEDISNDSAMQSRYLSENSRCLSGDGSNDKSYNSDTQQESYQNKVGADPLTLKVPQIVDHDVIMVDDQTLVDAVEKAVNSIQTNNGLQQHLGGSKNNANVLSTFPASNSRSYLSIPIDHKILSGSIESLVSIHGTSVLNEPAEVQERLSHIEFEMEEYLSETSKTSEASRQHTPSLSGSSFVVSLTRSSRRCSDSYCCTVIHDISTVTSDQSKSLDGSPCRTGQNSPRHSRGRLSLPDLLIEEVRDEIYNNLDNVTNSHRNIDDNIMNIKLDDVMDKMKVNSEISDNDNVDNININLSYSDSESDDGSESEEDDESENEVDEDSYHDNEEVEQCRNAENENEDGVEEKEIEVAELDDDNDCVDEENDEEEVKKDYDSSPVCQECEAMATNDQDRGISTDDTTDDIDKPTPTWLTATTRITQNRANSYYKIPSSDPDSSCQTDNVIHLSKSFTNGFQSTPPPLTYIEQCRLQSGNMTKRLSVRKARNMILKKASRNPKRAANNEKKASKVLGIIFGVFVTLWTPFFILNILSATCDSCMSGVTPELMSTFLWFGWIASLANPIIYTTFNTTFRRAFVKILTCKYKRTRRRSSTPESLLLNTPTNWITTSGTRRDTVTVNIN